MNTTLKIVIVIILILVIFGLGVFPLLHYILIQPGLTCDGLQNDWQQQCEQFQWLLLLAKPGIHIWTTILG